MSNDPVVVTAIGTVNAFGHDVQVLWDALERGDAPVTDISSMAGCPAAGMRVGPWPREALLGKRGLQFLSQGTQFLLGAAVLARNGAGLGERIPAPDDIGAVISTNLAGLASIAQFDLTTVMDGPTFCSPMEAPNTLANAPASHLAIKMHARALSATVSSGQCGGLDAIGYACRALQKGRATHILLGGVEELNPWVLALYKSMGCLPEDTDRAGRPFDGDAAGWLPGEGAAVMVLERQSTALARGARSLARLSGWGSSVVMPERLTDRIVGVRQAALGALAEASVDPSAVGLVVAGAGGVPVLDGAEAGALAQLVPDRPVCAIAGALGQTYGAAGIFQAVAAVGALQRRTVPATARYRAQSNAAPALGDIKPGSRSWDCGPGATVLLTSHDLVGVSSAVVVQQA
jgi:3-oxoacyl-[acyl-carrier-protein] synthase II